MNNSNLASPELPDLDRLEALVREYGNTPLLGAGRTRKVVMGEIHSMFARRAQPEGMSTALREVTDKLAATAAENLSLNMANIDLRDQLARVTGIRPEGEAPQAEQVGVCASARHCDFYRAAPQTALPEGCVASDMHPAAIVYTDDQLIAYGVAEAHAAQHAESGAPAPDAERVDAIVTGLYRRFKDWSKRGFGPDDVTWCEVKADVIALIASGAAEGGAQVELPSNEELESVWENHVGHPADFAADVLQRWGGWQPGLLGYGGKLAEALAAQSQGAQAVLRPLSAGLPDPGEHVRVLVYTEGVDFAGDQYFDILTEDLWEPDPDMREEIADAATHWMPLPMPGAALAAKAEAPAPADDVLGQQRWSKEAEMLESWSKPAAQQAAAPGALSEGWTLAPAKSDGAMNAAAKREYERPEATWGTIYAAMLAAAPSAPGTQEAPKEGA